MAELERYLQRLRDELPLPAAERDEAVEEIAAHIADAAAELVARGIPAESAERRIVSRFGPPDRLADQLLAARRGRWQLATAIGAATRTGLWAGFWGLMVAWLLLYVGFLAMAGVARLLGDMTGWDLSALATLSPRASIVVGSLAAAGAAYAVGRALPPTVALAARRREAVIRPWILVIGALAGAGIGTFLVEATFDPVSALVTASLPVWFALGVIRPQLLPRWYPSQAKTVGVVLLIVAALVFLPLALLSVADGSTQSGAVDVSDPVPSYAAIAPLDPAFEEGFVSTGTWSVGNGRVYEFVPAQAALLSGWRDLRLEIWLGLGPDDVQGVAVVDPSIGHAIASVPVIIDEAGQLSATLELPVIPERDHYLAALVGTSPQGERRLLSWPQDELARWSGSVWEYLTIDRPW